MNQVSSELANATVHQRQLGLEQPPAYAMFNDNCEEQYGWS